MALDPQRGGRAGKQMQWRWPASAVLALSSSAGMNAQGHPTASVRIPVSVFVQAGDTYTGLGGPPGVGGPQGGFGGRNISLTAGIDVGVFRRDRFLFAAEARGTYPLYQGHVEGQRSVLAGVRVSYAFEPPPVASLMVYGNVLAGRGAEHYVDGGYPTPAVLYLESTSAVYSAGAGFEIAVSRHIALKGEAEVQHWSIPVTTSGTIYAKQGAVGVVYRFADRRAR